MSRFEAVVSDRARGPWRAALICLVMVVSLVVPVSRADASPAWWDASYSHRLGVTVMTADALSSGYSLSVTFDHAAMVTAGNSLANGNDVRVARWNGSAWAELDRLLQPSTPSSTSAWNTTTTKIWFRSQTAISAATSDTSYYLYHGKPLAGSPPANGDNIFDLYDDFSGGALNGSKWTTYAATGVTATQTGGEFKISGTSSPGDPWSSTGLESVAGFTSGYRAESSFRIVTQSAAAHAEWKATLGNVDLGLNDQRVQYWSGSWVDTGASSLTAQTFTYHRVASGVTPSSTAQVLEDGVLKGSRSGVSGSSTLAFDYGPDVTAGNETFDVRFDDIFVRKHVINEPVTVLEQSADVTVSVTVDPQLLFVVADNVGGSCNGVSHGAGTTANGTSVSLGHLTPGVLRFRSQNLTVTSNAGGGFTVYARYSGAMVDGGRDVDDWTGTNASPTATWLAGTEAFGYTTSDASLSTSSGAANRFTSGGAKFAKLTTSDEEVSYSATGPVDDTQCVGYQAGASTFTAAGAYSTSVIYTAVPLY